MIGFTTGYLKVTVTSCITLFEKKGIYILHASFGPTITKGPYRKFPFTPTSPLYHVSITFLWRQLEKCKSTYWVTKSLDLNVVLTDLPNNFVLTTYGGNVIN